MALFIHLFQKYSREKHLTFYRNTHTYTLAKQTGEKGTVEDVKKNRKKNQARQP